MRKKIISFYFIIFFLIQCGFQPIYSERSIIFENKYETILDTINSIAVKESFNSIQSQNLLFEQILVATIIIVVFILLLVLHNKI